MRAKKLFKILLSRNIHSALVPYNFNVDVDRICHIYQTFLVQNPLSIMDIGARDGANPELMELSRYIDYVGFEPDSVECSRLNQTKIKTGFNTVSYFPYMVGMKKQTRSFFIHSEPTMSSLLELDPDFTRSFLGGNQAISRIIQVDSKPLDEICNEINLRNIDFIKIDTQGSELEILLSGENIIRETVLAIEVEVEFRPMYKDQPLFADVDIYLRNLGFELMYINRVLGKRSGLGLTHTRGQLIWGDVLYFKKPRLLRDFSPEKIMKAMVLAMVYGYDDFAYEVYRYYEKSLQEWKEIPLKAFSINKKSNLHLRLSNFAKFQITKLIFLLLAIRKWSGFGSDSDRNYPIR